MFKKKWRLGIVALVLVIAGGIFAYNKWGAKLPESVRKMLG